MSYVTERQSDLILAWIENRISSTELSRRYPIAAKKLDELGPRILNAALTTEDSFDVEHGLLVGFQLGVTGAYLAPLLALIDAPWHRQHENVIAALEELSAPESVDELYRAALARHGYLANDKTCSLGVRAIAALARIGDERAIEQLGKLLLSGQHILAKHAGKHLERICQRAASEALQQSARVLLESSTGRDGHAGANQSG